MQRSVPDKERIPMHKSEKCFSRAKALIGLLIVGSTCEARPQLGPVTANKPALTFSDLGKWPAVGDAQISNDGKYFAYSIQAVNEEGERQIFFTSLGGGWTDEISGVARLVGGSATSGHFSEDSSLYLFSVGTQLCWVTLSTRQRACLPNVGPYRTAKGWLAYEPSGQAGELVLRNLHTFVETRYHGVVQYWLKADGASITLHTRKDAGASVADALEIRTLATGASRLVWSAPAAAPQPVSIAPGRAPSGDGQTLSAFAVTAGEGDAAATSIWTWKGGLEPATLRVSEATDGMPSGTRIGSVSPFLSQSGRYISFYVEVPNAGAKATEDSVKVDVWNHRDSVIQSMQLQRLSGEPTLRAAFINESGGPVSLYEDDVDDAVNAPNAEDSFLTGPPGNQETDAFWRGGQPSYHLTSLRDGSKTGIQVPRREVTGVMLTPSGREVLFYDQEHRAYVTYDIASRRSVDISKGVEPGALEWDNEEGGNEYKDTVDHRIPIGIAAWVNGGRYAIVHDNFDLWKLDLTGATPAVNITHSYGKAHGIRFRLLGEDYFHRGFIDEKQELLLMGYVRATKENGFFRKVGLKDGDPEVLSIAGGLSYNVNYGDPLKARDARRWVVTRQSATEAPNYFWTDDFKNYHQITHVAPQKAYNWLTAELVHWKDLEGKLVDGILYKPENFDPKKKYPVLFNYYEFRSRELYEFHYPYYTQNNINIPWFVSQGYVVVVPDVAKRIGDPGAGATSAIVSAAQYMTSFPWVDARHMGIQGHSYGGYETNVLVTRSSLFAAACSASGIANIESFYGELNGNVGSAQVYFELSQGGMGVPLWSDLEGYRRNSPVFDLAKVSTPILLVANKNDPSIFRQETQMFMGLRRLDKPVWLLQYDQEGHSIFIPKDSADFTVRLTQFFDHYLKDAPPPKWMTEGVPARLKGIETGLELDTSGVVP